MLRRDPLRVRLANRIRSRGIRAVARRAGLDHSALSSWLSGKRDMRVSMLERVLEAIDLEIGFVDLSTRGTDADRP